MIYTKRQLQKIIREELQSQAVTLKKGRNLGYGEGEGRMTRSQLHHVAEYAAILHDMIRDEDDLPEWVQSKISVMASDIGKVKHYLEYKILRMPVEERVLRDLLLREFNPQARARAQSTRSRGTSGDILSQLQAATQEVVDGGKGLFDISTILGKSPYGIPSKTVTSPLPMVIVDWEGKKYAILNSKYAEDPDAVVGKFAIGAME